jgi:hypothetical protein
MILDFDNYDVFDDFENYVHVDHMSMVMIFDAVHTSQRFPVIVAPFSGNISQISVESCWRHNLLFLFLCLTPRDATGKETTVHIDINVYFYV